MGQRNFLISPLGQPIAAAWIWPSADFTLGPGVPADLAISGTPATSATAGVAYSFTPTASGGVEPYEFSLTGALPPGLSFDPVTGTISGTAL